MKEKIEKIKNKIKYIDKDVKVLEVRVNPFYLAELKMFDVEDIEFLPKHFYIGDVKFILDHKLNEIKATKIKIQEPSKQEVEITKDKPEKKVVQKNKKPSEKKVAK